MTFLWLTGDEVNRVVLGISIISLLVPTRGGPCSCVQPEDTILYLGGGLSFGGRTQRSIPTPKEPGPPCPALLFLHSLTLLISKCLRLPFEPQGRSTRLKHFPSKQEMGDMGKLLDIVVSHSILLGFNRPLL